MLKGTHCECGRTLLGWTAEHLAARTGIGPAQIRMYERMRDTEIPEPDATTLKRHMEAQGLSFYFDPPGPNDQVVPVAGFGSWQDLIRPKK